MLQEQLSKQDIARINQLLAGIGTYPSALRLLSCSFPFQGAHIDTSGLLTPDNCVLASEASA